MKRIDILKKFMRNHRACESAKRYVRRYSHLSPKALWDKCENGDYLGWLVYKVYRNTDVDYMYDINRDVNNRYPYVKVYYPENKKIEKLRVKYRAKLIKERVKYSQIADLLF